LSKKDASPVTIGDFASQALALQLLFNRFPNDMYIAEEGSEALRLDEELLERVWKAVNSAWSSLDSDNNVWYERGELLRAIDYGQGKGMPVVSATATTRRRRVWCLDPIDGTKGFLRGRVEGGQYCIALALLEDGEPVLSILGCPNLPLPLNQSSKSSRGSLFVAIRGCGCYEKALHTNDDEAAAMWNQLHVTRNDGSIKTPSQSTFCLGVERGFSDPKGTVLKMAQHIDGDDAITTDAEGVPDINNSMRLDGQGKYGLLARGDAEYFVRLPKDGYVDWIWDVAAGYLILKEAGGIMTDVHGNCI
ncbi:bisphosphate nucleotidase, partial [Thalassiosira pseudonana CCMP1335]